jgi:hypothetical protein
MALKRRQTEDPRKLREVLDDLIETVDGLAELNDGEIVAGVKAVGAIANEISAVGAIANEISAVADIAEEIEAVLDTPGKPDLAAGAEADLKIAVTIQARTLADDDLESFRMLHVIISDTTIAEPSVAGVAGVTATTGNILDADEYESNLYVATDDKGKAVIEVEAADAGDLYMKVFDGSNGAQIKLEYAGT